MKRLALLLSCALLLGCRPTPESQQADFIRQGRIVAALAEQESTDERFGEALARAKALSAVASPQMEGLAHFRYDMALQAWSAGLKAWQFSLRKDRLDPKVPADKEFADSILEVIGEQRVTAEERSKPLSAMALARAALQKGNQDFDEAVASKPFAPLPDSPDPVPRTPEMLPEAR